MSPLGLKKQIQACSRNKKLQYKLIHELVLMLIPNTHKPDIHIKEVLS